MSKDLSKEELIELLRQYNQNVTTLLKLIEQKSASPSVIAINPVTSYNPVCDTMYHSISPQVGTVLNTASVVSTGINTKPRSISYNENMFNELIEKVNRKKPYRKTFDDVIQDMIKKANEKNEVNK